MNVDDLIKEFEAEAERAQEGVDRARGNESLTRVTMFDTEKRTWERAIEIAKARAAEDAKARADQVEWFYEILRAITALDREQTERRASVLFTALQSTDCPTNVRGTLLGELLRRRGVSP